MTLSDSRSMRAGTGIGIAIAVAATVGAIAFLAPKLRDEMREDIFSGARTAKVPVAVPASAPARASTPVGEPAAPPVALKPATAIVPAGSLGPGESEVATAPAPKAAASHATAARGHHRAPASERKKPIEPIRNARLPAPRLVVDDTPVRPLPAPRAAYRERVVPRREANRDGRLVGGIHREDPMDFRTWRFHRNPDAPPTSPVERQPG